MGVNVSLGILFFLCLCLCIIFVLSLALYVMDDSDNAITFALTVFCGVSAYVVYQCFLALGW